MTAVESKFSGQGTVPVEYRWNADVVDLNSTDSRVVLDVRGLSTLGGQLALNAGSVIGSTVIQFRGRMLYEDQRSNSGGDDREGLPFAEIDGGVRLEGEGCTDRNIDVSRYAQVEGVVTTPSGAAAEGTLVIYGER